MRVASLGVVEGAEFVRRVMTALGAESPAQLAEKMRWKRGTERLIAKWLTGQNDPSYAYTMDMLERVGWIALGHSKDEDPPQRAAGLDPRLVQALEQIADVAAKLDALASEQELPTGAPQAPIQTRRRRRTA